MPPSPFRADRYDLRPPSSATAGVHLVAIPKSATDELGAAFAAIDPWAFYGYQAEALASYLAREEAGAVRLALASGDSIAGALCIRLDWLRGPYLQFLGVLPAFQGRGLGALALTWLEGEARAAAARNIFVCAAEFNRGAVAFYERAGFEPAARLDGLVADGVAEILLRKRLA